MKTIIATVGAVMTAVTLGAQEADEKAAEVEGQQEETPVFEAGFDLDLYSAYVWRNAIQNDHIVIQPGVWADFTMLDPFWFGFSVWQNYDLDDCRREDLRRALTETDYNVHAGVTAWASEDEEMSLEFEIGHDWYENQFVRGEVRGDYASTRELYLKGTFANPLVDVYGQMSWMYRDCDSGDKGLHYEVGLNKEVALVEDALTLGMDGNVDFGDSDYLCFLHGEVGPNFDKPRSGVGGMTLMAYLTWDIADWVAVKGTFAWTSILDNDIRAEYEHKYRDYLWYGVSLNFAF